MAILESRKKIEELLESKEYSTIHNILDKELTNKNDLANENEERIRRQSKGLILYLKARTYLLEKNFDLSIKTSLLSLEIREELNVKTDIIDSLLLIGEIYFQKFHDQKWSLPEELDKELTIEDHFKSINQIYLGEISDFSLADKSVEYFKRCLEIQKNFSPDLEIAETLDKLQIVYQAIKDFGNSLKINYELLDIYSKHGSEKQKAYALRNVGWTIWGNLSDTRNHGLRFDEALKYINESIKINEKLNNEEELAWIHTNIFFIYRYGIGDTELAIKTLEEGLTLFEKLNDHYGQVWIYYLLASFFYNDLKLKKTLKYLDQCLKIISSSNNEKFSSTCIIGIIHSVRGNTHLLMGNFEQAMESFNISLSYILNNHSFPIHDHLANAIIGIAKINLIHSDFESALKWVKKAIYFGKKNSINLFGVNINLSTAIDIALETKYIEYAKMFLEYVDENKTRTTSYSESLYQQTSSALIKAKILMQSKRLKNKVEADQILQKIIKNCKYTILKIEAMLLVSKLRLFEFQITGDSEVLEEFKDQIENLLAISKTKNLPNFTVEILKLKSQFQLIEGNLEESRNLLNKALVIAKMKDLVLHQFTLSHEIEKLDEEFQKWTFLINKNRIFHERIKQSQLEDYINKALKIARIYDQRE